MVTRLKRSLKFLININQCSSCFCLLLSVLRNLNVGWSGPFPVRVEEPKQRLVFFCCADCSIYYLLCYCISSCAFDWLGCCIKVGMWYCVEDLCDLLASVDLFCMQLQASGWCLFNRNFSYTKECRCYCYSNFK